MPTLHPVIAKAAAMLLIAAVLTLPASPAILSASGPAQDSSATPEITEPECSFWLDYDGDGEGNEPFDADPDEYILTRNPCSWRLHFQAQCPHSRNYARRVRVARLGSHRCP